MKFLPFVIFLLINSLISAQNFTWTPQNSGTTENLTDVYFVDNLNGWAVGEKGTIVHTTDGGQNWTSQTSGTSEILRAVFFIDAKTGWAVGGLNTKTMIMTMDGGTNWTDITPGNISSVQLRDIAFADAKNGWFIHSDSIYRTTDGGTSWVIEDYHSDISKPANWAIAVTSDSTAYVAGNNKRTGIFNEYADVFNRRPNSAPDFWGPSAVSSFQTDDKLRSIEFADFEIGFAGGERGILYKFEPLVPGITSGPWEKNLDLKPAGIQIINSISFSSPGIGMFNTSADVSGNQFALIYHTSDTGRTWSSTPDSIADLLAGTLHSPDANIAWIVGAGGKIYKGVPKPIGINEIGLNMDIHTYPNPTSGVLNIKILSEGTETMNYNLMDATGRIVRSGKWNLNASSSLITLNLSTLTDGIYLLELSTDKGKTVLRISKN
jgi:photosystem II stability/assembly factor-like uncharacterized protein